MKNPKQIGKKQNNSIYKFFKRILKNIGDI